MTSVQLPDLTDVREGLALRRQVRIAGGEWARRHAASACLLVPLLVLVGAVHAIGMWSFPRWVDDPGTYLSQAWSFQYQRALSPYSYIYDHAPAGWIQLSLWSMLTDGFNRHDSAIGFGNECMLIAKLASCALLFALGRRLQLSRLGAAGTVMLFGLCPLELMYSRWTFLDNLVTPWLLAFVLAASPRRSILAATGAALSFAMANLTKETALVVLPALVWALVQKTWIAPADRGGRVQRLLIAMYPLPSTRVSCSSVRAEQPARHRQMAAGRARVQRLAPRPRQPHHPHGRPVARHRPLAPARRAGRHPRRPAGPPASAGSRCPGHPVAGPSPWWLRAVHARRESDALERAGRRGAVEIVAGNRRLATFRPLARGRSTVRPLSRLQAMTTGLDAVCLAAVLVGSWIPTLRPMLQAVHHYGFDPQPIIVYKLDTTRRSASACAASTMWSCRTGTTPPRRAWPSTRP
jgi:hypothetical protein